MQPPATAASTTSLTVPLWAWPTCLATSGRPRTIASRRSVPTGRLRLVAGAGCSVRTSRQAGSACRARRRVLPGCVRPDHPRPSSCSRRRRLSRSNAPAVGAGVGVHGRERPAGGPECGRRCQRWWRRSTVANRARAGAGAAAAGTGGPGAVSPRRAGGPRRSGRDQPGRAGWCRPEWRVHRRRCTSRSRPTAAGTGPRRSPGPGTCLGHHVALPSWARLMRPTRLSSIRRARAAGRGRAGPGRPCCRSTSCRRRSARRAPGPVPCP